MERRSFSNTLKYIYIKYIWSIANSSYVISIPQIEKMSTG